ncbi:cytochrome c [Marimonas sp. MJW-29]|uniref:Cytochrome c n=1 Tax=Sulfitobacter sediminis TaxID=3234186 RepID=A0ABV3RLB5_9RHOB
MKPYLAALTALALIPCAALAQDAQIGAELYDTHCAVCHGAEVRGNGPLAPAMVLQPPNLRTLKARYDGVFPTVRVVTRIDGRDPLVAHGSPMPVYGEFFEGEDVPMKAETGQPIITSRPVVDLVAFLEAIQE